MKQSASPGSPEQWKQDEPTPERRRLLKAAAAAAPLVATLQSGAARATSSTAQCVVNDRQVAQGGGIAGSTTDQYADRFLRVPGWKAQFQQVDNDNTVTKAIVYTEGENEAPYYYENGELFVSSGWTYQGARPVYLLRFYVAGSDTNEVATNPTCAVDCDRNDQEPDIFCFYPKDQMGLADNDADGRYGNNTALSQSCVTSVTPSFTGESCPT